MSVNIGTLDALIVIAYMLAVLAFSRLFSGRPFIAMGRTAAVDCCD